MKDQNATGESSEKSSGAKKYFLRFFSKKKSEGEKLLSQHEAKGDMDKKLALDLRRHGGKKIPTWKQLHQLGQFFSRRESWVVRIAFFLVVVSLIVLFVNFWMFTLQPVAARGGEYSEGLVGSPKYLNPILSSANSVDADINSLIFSGLMKREPSGLTTDLAESYSVSEDQKEYIFNLRRGIKWHDSEEEFTADDVVFTFQTIKDPEVDSYLAVSFRGIEIERVDDYTVKFVLKEPFAPFLSTLTFGILPGYLWDQIDPKNFRLAELNLKPVGCGPFKFSSLKKNKNGEISQFTLAANDDYYVGRPYLDKVVFKFYSDSESLKQALANRNVLAASYLPLKERSDILGDQLSAGGLSLRPLKLSQYSAVFFNQSAGSLKEKAVRQALSRATDRQRIVREALADAGAIVDSPILPGFIGYYPDIAKYDYAPNEATALLDADKWQAITPNDYISWSREQEKKNLGDQFVDRPDAERLAETSGQEYFRRKGDEVLEITLTLVDQPENLAVVKIVKENWEQIGVKINLNVIPGSDIRREAIKPRHYEALLYSEIIGYDPDPYPFWHSSQVEDPGLNLSMFVDKRVDGYIEAARQSSDVKVRAENYQKFQDILASEAPAIFLYQPDYPYVVSDQVKGLAVDNIFVPADRLLDMTKRYIKTRRSW